MYPFTIVQPKDIAGALQAVQNNPSARFIGGGTNLVDLMKMNIERPTQLIDINKLGLNTVKAMPHGGVLIGALVKNSDLAYHQLIAGKYPLLSQALLSGASPQLRNMATVGGNLLQRTRCPYFYDTVTACNKREPGSGCTALKSYNRMHAVLGTSDACIATHPSDMCVALAALDAVVHVANSTGQRTIAFEDLHLLPGKTPEKENSLAPGELITAVEIPGLSFAQHSCYIKVRDRHSYEFALSSAAVALQLNAGKVQQARIALGGVATKPWRAKEAEEWLTGKPANDDSFKQAASIALQHAVTQHDNAFKPQLAERTILRACKKIQEG